MFIRFWQNNNVKKSMTRVIMLAGVTLMLLVLTGCAVSKSSEAIDVIEDISPESLIRFHVIANSDSDEDQLLKYAIRDEILKIAAPRLAESKSIDESRQLLMEMQGEFLDIANSVLDDYGTDYGVTIEHGKHLFPTKSYGRIILPGGEYEAVKIMIGEAQGQNWWCVLFPPICFVNVEESTTVTVDGKQGVLLEQAGKEISDKNREEKEIYENHGEKEIPENPKVKFYLSRFLQ